MVTLSQPSYIGPILLPRSLGSRLVSAPRSIREGEKIPLSGLQTPSSQTLGSDGHSAQQPQAAPASPRHLPVHACYCAVLDRLSIRAVSSAPRCSPYVVLRPALTLRTPNSLRPCLTHSEEAMWGGSEEARQLCRALTLRYHTPLSGTMLGEVSLYDSPPESIGASILWAATRRFVIAPVGW